MQVTFFSFCMAAGWSSLLIVLVYFFRKKHLSIRFFSILGLVQLYLFCAIRILLPVELPFTKVIASRNIYTKIYRFVNTSFTVGNNSLTIGRIAAYIWLFTSLSLLCRLFYQYRKSMKEIKNYDTRLESAYQNTLAEVIKEKKARIQPTILISPSINTPMSFGILDKYILLPDREYERQEIYYILMHEYTHLANGDLLVKMLIHILCRVYWWNPFVYLLQRDLEQTLEIKCDLAITKDMDNEKKADYLKTIVSSIKKVRDKEGNWKKESSIIVGTANLFKETSIGVKERFEVVSLYRGKGSDNLVRATMIFFFLVTLTMSYMFIIQPEFDAPLEEIETEEGIYEINADQVIVDEEGIYKIILPDGNFIIIDEETVLKMQELEFIY